MQTRTLMKTARILQYLVDLLLSVLHGYTSYKTVETSQREKNTLFFWMPITKMTITRCRRRSKQLHELFGLFLRSFWIRALSFSSVPLSPSLRRRRPIRFLIDLQT